MDSIYGDHVHNNPGSHLSAGIPDDSLWQHYYRSLVTYNASCYHLPSNSIGKDFISVLTGLCNGIRTRQHNSEKFLVFPLVVLQRSLSITKSPDIKKRIAHRLALWKAGKYQLLVQETPKDLQNLQRIHRGNTTQAQRLQTYNRLLLQGELRRAIRFISDRDQATIYDPDSSTPGGDIVLDVLHSKHPEQSQISHTDLPHYPTVPELVPLQVTDEDLSSTARHLHGAAGLGGTDAHTLKHWLFHFRQQSQLLRQSLCRLTEWMANQLVPWAAIRALFSNRLLAFAKPDGGVRPIAVGQIWRRLLAKIVIRLTGEEATIACGSSQLCCGLAAGIEGGIHAAQQFWSQHAATPEFGFLQVDATNAFNQIDRTAMLWVTRHEWPRGALFVFNCYKHHALLVIHGSTHELQSLPSQTGVAQGCPLAMIVYGLTLLPIIRDLRQSFPRLLHIWYADDSNAAGTWAHLRRYWKELTRLGPKYGYLPNGRKTILLVPPNQLQAAANYKRTHNLPFQLKTGSRFLGGFLGDPSQFDRWLSSKVTGWQSSLEALTAAFPAYPQSAFAGLQKSLQNEWQFCQRVNPCEPEAFTALETVLSSHILPNLYGQQPPQRALTALPVKFSGLSIPRPTDTCTYNLEVSKEVTKDLVTALLNPQTTFSLQDHQSTVAKARTTCSDAADVRHEAALESLISACTLPPTGPDEPALADTPKQRLLRRAQLTGRFLTVYPSYANNTVLSTQEFRDRLLYRYGMQPSDLPTTCDGCTKPFTVDHAMSCPVGGLIHARHNELAREIGSLYAEATANNCVATEPMIFPSPATAPATAPATSPTLDPDRRKQDRADLLLRHLYGAATDCLIDVTIVDLNAKSYNTKDPETVLRGKESGKKKHYLKACLQQRRHFAPFVASTDGLLGREARNLLKAIGRKLSDKWQQPLSTVISYISARISISLARACHRCLRGSRIHFKKTSSPFLSRFQGPTPPPGEYLAGMG